MKSYLFAVACLFVLFSGSGCTKDPLKNLSEEESRVYISRHDESADFTNYTTFCITDSVAIIENNRLRRHSLSSTDTSYLNALRTQMQQRGYTEVRRDENPDLVINVSRIYNSNTGAFNYTDYIDHYAACWDPTYWGYPEYRYIFPNYYGVYDITEGAFSIDILDLKHAGNNNTRDIYEVWNGLVRGTGVFRNEKVNTAVKKLFDQSAYLRKVN